jgi:hypothetical protein
MCTGSALKDERVGDALDLLGGTARTERVASEDSVLFNIDGESGEARLPRRMQSAYKEPIKGRPGWFRLIEVRQTDDEITGKVRIHGINKPQFRLDRLSGVVTIHGQIADFSGRCEAYDPATVQRRF